MTLSKTPALTIKTLAAAGISGFGKLLSMVVDVLRTRLAGGELAMRCAHAAMLHLGAKGYLMRSPAQRRLREAYFVGIVTPATKHLRREIARLTRTTPEFSAQAVAA